MSYAKLFSSITESSLWSEPPEVRILFVSMLAKADATGFVEAAIPGLARLSNLPQENVEKALVVLESPDPHSKDLDVNPVNQGRRICKVPGGWMVINYETYRDRRDEEERREWMRNYMRNYRKDLRDRKQPVKPVNQGKPLLAQAEAEAEAEAEAVRTHTQSVPTSMEPVKFTEPVSERVELKTLLPDKGVKYEINPGLLSLKKGLCELFKRDEKDPWSCIEEHLLFEIHKRPNHSQEFNAIRGLLRRLDRKKFFPQKLERLLADWTGTLDRARRAEKNPSMYGGSQ